MANKSTSKITTGEEPTEDPSGLSGEEPKKKAKLPNRFRKYSSNQRACLRLIISFFIVCCERKRKVTGECGYEDKY